MVGSIPKDEKCRMQINLQRLILFSLFNYFFLFWGGCCIYCTPLEDEQRWLAENIEGIRNSVLFSEDSVYTIFPQRRSIEWIVVFRHVPSDISQKEISGIIVKEYNGNVQLFATYPLNKSIYLQLKDIYPSFPANQNDLKELVKMKTISFNGKDFPKLKNLVRKYEKQRLKMHFSKEWVLDADCYDILYLASGNKMTISACDNRKATNGAGLDSLLNWVSQLSTFITQHEDSKESAVLLNK